MTFSAFKVQCVLNGDDPAAVDAFIDWVKKNPGIFKLFERIAYQDMQNGNRGDPMWTMGELRRELRRRQQKILVVNAVSPGLCRMFNFKHKKRFFQVGKMKSFSAEFREAA